MAPAKQKRNRANPLRRQILDAALHLFTNRGYFNTSIHDIRMNADVAMGSIYNYFTGKEAIAKALYDDLLSRMEAVVDDAVAGHDRAFDQGAAIVKTLFELSETQPEVIGFVLNARHREFLPQEPSLCSSAPFAKMRDIVATAMQRGEITNMDPWVASAVLFGPALRLVSLRLDGVISTPLSEMADDVWHTSWNGVRDRND